MSPSEPGDNYLPNYGNNMPSHPKPDDKGMIGEGIKFERTRRITGYLVGSLERFNNAKRAEEKDRVKHGTNQEE